MSAGAEIVVEHVSKRFGRVRALRDINLTIEPGERVAFVGANGSGKTTLLRALLSVLRYEGRVTIGGHDVTRAPVQALALLAYVPQAAPPIDVPVPALLRTWSALRGVPVSEVSQRAAAFGLELAGQVDKRFADLSGGMKQKLLSALALASAAPVLVCDEPTANLDPAARAAFFDQVAGLPSHHTVLLCSHRLDEVRQLVTRVVELNDGAVAYDGSASALLDALPAYQVEVWLQEPAQAAAAFLVSRGFSAAGRDRYAAQLTQQQKLDTIEVLMRVHAGCLRDLSVYRLEAMTPKLRAVP